MPGREKIEVIRRKYKTVFEINDGKGVEKREPSSTVGGDVNWYSLYGEQRGGSLKN